MKRLLHIGISAGVRSLFPILVWVALEVTTHDEYIGEGFIVSYPFQFVYLLVTNVIIEGTFAYECKQDNMNVDAMKSSILVGFIAMLLICSVPLIFIGNTLKLLGLTSEYATGLQFGVVALVFDIIPCGVATMFNYLGKDSKSDLVSFSYYGIRLALAFVLGKLFGVEKACYIMMCILFIMCGLIIINWCIPKKLYVNCFKGAKYKRAELANNIITFMIYFFGIGKIASNSVVALQAINAVALCTDTQWDMLSNSIVTYTSVKVSEDRYEAEEKQIYKDGALFGLLLTTSGFIALVIYRQITEFSLSMAFIYASLEITLMWLCCIIKSIKTYLVLQKDKYNQIAVNSTIKYCLRALSQFVIPSKFAISICVLVGELYETVTVGYMYHKIKVKKHEYSHL